MTFLRMNSTPRTSIEQAAWNQSYEDLKLISNDVLARLYFRHSGQRDSPLSGRLCRAIKKELNSRSVVFGYLPADAT